MTDINCLRPPWLRYFCTTIHEDLEGACEAILGF